MTTREVGADELRAAWYRWTRSVARGANAADAKLAEAVRAFVSLDTDAGRAAEDWLKSDAINAYPSVVTWIIELDGVIQGFYSLAGTQVRLSQRDRRRLSRSSNSRSIGPAQPASLITHFARHRDSRLLFREILLHAMGTALAVQELQGNVALVIEPFDSMNAEVLQRQYGFRPAVRESYEGTYRLWLPLPAPDMSP